MKAFKFIAAIVILMAVYSVRSQAGPLDADFAWLDVQKSAVLPTWDQSQPPTEEQEKQFYQHSAEVATAAAKKAKAFYTQYPDSPNEVTARRLECSMLQSAFSQGDRSQDAFDTWKTALNGLLQDTNASDDDRFDARMDLAQSIQLDPKLDGKSRETGYEQALRQLIKEFPQRDEPLEQLVNLAAESENDDEARSIATEVLAAPVSDSVKAKANAILDRLQNVGKPLDIKFTALDGRQVDLTQVKGKVILVDFWATWCGPCVGEIPEVKEAYDKFHPKGFEVVGISFDSDKSRLQDFIKTHDMPWPQYFDGKDWQNKFGVQYGINAIPTMWLVDKNGNLRVTNARGDLQGQVQNLLAE
jgi:thiol-disulfide isomerase/thioredoxin